MSGLTPEQFRRARDLFEAALDSPPADLAGWLAGQTDDDAVRREVTSLLQHHTEAGDFLTEPVGHLEELLADEAADGGEAAERGDAPELVAGDTIGRYRIEREAGRGGMGRVYRAVDTQLKRTVAIKALPSNVASAPSRRERLRREAQAAAALSHPGICTVYALEELDGQLYIVTEFIEGETLQAASAADHRPAATLVVDAARQLAAALASAHAAGVTHRDLKPENVMRTSDGRFKILDFGLARLPEPEATASPMVTQPGAVFGTLAYMAPEQVNGLRADARTDLFALGVVLYEFAAGRHPFEAATPLARAGRVLEATPDPLAAQRPDVPPAVVAAIERCLAKAPADRFADARELLHALDGAASGEVAGAAAVVTPAAGTARHWWRLHQVVVIGLYFVAVILAWFIKEWLHGAASPAFIAMGVLGTIVGMLRGHLVFTERTHGIGLQDERRRLGPVTLIGDLVMALVLAGDGLALVSASREVAGVLTIALAVSLAVARLVLEPGTTRAAFDE